MPEVEIISPWKDPEWLNEFKGRTDLIDYAKKENIPIDVTHEKPYSTDENTPLSVPARGVLNNDTDPDATDILAVTSILTTGTVGQGLNYGWVPYNFQNQFNVPSTHLPFGIR